MVFLDAKAAFDVVNHDHLIRRLHHSGIQDKHLSLVHDLHSGSSSSIKWMSEVSKPFKIEQGVKQGGVLSTDLYKAYIDPLLHRYEDYPAGALIGDVLCNAIACADDVAVCAQEDIETQILINIAEDFANNERYILQPTKTESLLVKPSQRKHITPDTFELYGKSVPNVNRSTHLGIIRASTTTETAEANVERNITKARRTVYSLMASGLHGENGLDPETSLHLLKTYVTPLLLYGLEVILPRTKHLQTLEVFQKKLLKQILSLPTNANDSAVYMLSGFLPVEGQIHKKALTLFNNICNQPEQAIEKRLAVRQLNVKDTTSHSWFVDVKRILWKYDLPEPEALLTEPVKSSTWKTQINKAVDGYWREKILGIAEFSTKLEFMNCVYTPGRPHPTLLIPIKSTCNIRRIPTKLRIMTGTYQLQSTKQACNQNAVDPTCKLCKKSPETLDHFLLHCQKLEEVSGTAWPEISQELVKIGMDLPCLTDRDKVKTLVDCTYLLKGTHRPGEITKLSDLEFLCRRLVNNLHVRRLKLLSELRK